LSRTGQEATWEWRAVGFNCNLIDYSIHVLGVCGGQAVFDHQSLKYAVDVYVMRT